jgi:hypothetical protein
MSVPSKLAQAWPRGAPPVPTLTTPYAGRQKAVDGHVRGGERVGIDTVSTTVARSFNGNARSSSQVKVLARVLVGHQRASLAIAFTRSFGVRTHVPLTLERFTRSASDQDGCSKTARARAPPSNRHGRSTSETAAAGTCAKDARRQIAKAKGVPTGPLTCTCYYT